MRTFLVMPSGYTMTTGDVAQRFDVSIDTIQRWTDQGLIECRKLPSGWRRYRPEDVEAFANAMHDREPAA